MNPVPLTLSLAQRLVIPFEGLWRALAQLLRFASELFRLFFPQRAAKKQRVRPWMAVMRSKSQPAASQPAVAEEDVRRLLDRMKQLDDAATLSDRAVAFAGLGTDHFADPREVQQLIDALVRQNPPFLHVACERPAADENGRSSLAKEYILRDVEVVVREPATLFVPQVGVEHLESRRPPGLPVIRYAKSLSDLRQTPLVYQSLPEDLLIARLMEGSIPLLAYREERRYLLFKKVQRILERRERRRSRVEVELESAESGSGTRLMYMLFDRSTSLVHNCTPRGSNAVMELAIALAMIRADMGRPHARWYFRAFADGLDPIRKDKPLSAATVSEKEWLAQRLMRTNFCGDATRVVEALETACDDIEEIARSGELGPNVKPRIGLLTDGRCTLYANVGARLKRLGIELDTILIGRDAVHNPELIRISSTVCAVDPELYKVAMAA